MVVAQVKRSLLRQCESQWIALTQPVFQITDLLLTRNTFRGFQFPQMLFYINYPELGKIIAGVAAAELKYLFLIVALIPGLAHSCTPFID